MKTQLKFTRYRLAVRFDFTKIILFYLGVVMCLLVQISCSQSGLHDDDIYHQLKSGFYQLPDSTKPWVYWYWVSDQISRTGITKDLEMMDSLGIGAALIGNIYLSNIERGKVPVLSTDWYAHLLFAIKEGTRLGIDIGLFNGPGWVQSGGPWIDSTMAMRYVILKDTIVGEGAILHGSDLKIEKSQPIALFAYQAIEDTVIREIPRISTNFADLNPTQLFDENLNTDFSFPSAAMENENLMVDIDFDLEQTYKSITFLPSEEPFYVEFELQVLESNQYIKVCDGIIDRSNPMLTVGPVTFGPEVKSFSEQSGHSWRIIFSGLNQNKVWFSDIKRNGGLREIRFSENARLENYVEKQLGKMYQLPSPEWQEYQWHEQVEYSDIRTQFDPEGIIELSFLLENNNTIWKAPNGTWRVYKVAMQPTGVTNAPVSEEALGLDVDKMNKKYVWQHFDQYLSPLLDKLNEEELHALKYLVIDSYETGSQNWTDGLREKFVEKYNYDPLPWFPVFAGEIVKSAELSDRFLWDLRRIIADEISYEYVGSLREKAVDHNLKLWVENYGHWGFPGEFLQYGGKADFISGEFWLDDPLGSIECRAASSAGHIYGVTPIFAEAFTAPRKHFMRYPGLLRKRGDWSYTQGINHHVLHVYIHQPYQDTFPGINAWFGVEFNRQNIWFPRSKCWFDYLRRNHFLLQQGIYQADVCYFIGEGTPVMTGIKNPVLPEGYSFDFINAEIILNDLKVHDHRLVLSSGMSYGLMVLPPLNTMTPELMEKIEALIKNGAYILGDPPVRSPSLKGYPKCDSLVNMISGRIWKPPAANENKTIYGQGMIFVDSSLQKVLDEIGIAPDLLLIGESATDSILWIHRKKGAIEIYFLTNQSNQLVKVDADFRVNDKFPEIWDAVNGEQRGLFEYDRRMGRTQIHLEFKPGESFYVLFSENARKKNNAKNFPDYLQISDLSNEWKIQFDSSLKGPSNEIVTKELFDWSKHDSDSIKYYSGKAIYQKEFHLDTLIQRKYFLSLGELNGIVDVSLNAKRVGGVWTEHSLIELSDFIQPGMNILRIDFTSTWVNRLIGDSRISEPQRITWAAENPYRPNDSLQKSGLLGPVKLLIRNE